MVLRVYFYTLLRPVGTFVIIIFSTTKYMQRHRRRHTVSNFFCCLYTICVIANLYSLPLIILRMFGWLHCIFGWWTNIMKQNKLKTHIYTYIYKDKLIIVRFVFRRTSYQIRRSFAFEHLDNVIGYLISFFVIQFITSYTRIKIRNKKKSHHYFVYQ